MSDAFQYEVFLSYSSKDKLLVRKIAERLNDAGLRVWFDEWIIKPDDNVPEKTEEGLDRSRVLFLCMSANAFGADWPRLEASTLRFRDPLNWERRFVLLRLDDAPIKESLAQFLYINWLPENREQEYSKLLRACQIPPTQEAQNADDRVAEKCIDLDCEAKIEAYAFSRDGQRILTGGADKTVRIWDAVTGRCLRVIKSHRKRIRHLDWSDDQERALVCIDDDNVRLLDVSTDRILADYGKSLLSKRQMDCLRLLAGGGTPKQMEGHLGLWCTTVQQHLRELREKLNLATRNELRSLATRIYRSGGKPKFPPLKAHPLWLPFLAWIVERDRSLSGRSKHDQRFRLCTKYGGGWRTPSGQSPEHWRDVSGERDRWQVSSESPPPNPWSAAWSTDRRYVIYGSADGTLLLWDAIAGKCLRIFEGHTGSVDTVSWNADQRLVLSGSLDKTVRLWDVQSGRCLAVLKKHTSAIRRVEWSENPRYAFSGDESGRVWVWNLSEFITNAGKTILVPDQVQYTNAKVLLVGESGAGKTGLSKRLALNDWQPSDSTVGAWATQWKLSASVGNHLEREIWLWDFGGQADQRLIHQLYMDETALAVLVFDGQKDDLFGTLGQWDRDLTRASRKPFAKLLVAGRIDASVLRASRQQLETFACERGFNSFLETSAKNGSGCKDLKLAIINGIRWEEIPWRTSPTLFKRLKEEIIRLKDEGRVLMRFNELRETLRLRLQGEGESFTDEELKAVIALLAGPGAVWELKFGSWVLLQPERINAYAQAVIQTLRDDPQERGCIAEEKVLGGELKYQLSVERLPEDEERIVLLAMHQILVERALCMREPTEKGTLLIFPSYYRRERPELVGHPAVQVSYRFNGFIDEIYATLVVKLHHTQTFEKDQLWRYAADFRTLTGKILGVKLTLLGEGAGEIAVYFDPTIPLEERIIFSKYVYGRRRVQQSFSRSHVRRSASLP